MFENSENDLSEKFVTASNHVRSIHGKLSSDDLLYLYSRYKQATEGNCNTTRPGFFDFQGKQKWDSWKALEKKSQEESMLEYIGKVTDVDPDWEDNIKSGSKVKSGLGLGVSRFADQEVYLNDEDKSIFDFCQDGNVKKLNELLNKTNIDDKDENGMSLLHWSCDRGYVEIVKFLLDKGADINLQDNDLQTALHYAVFCNYLDVTKVLLSHGADCNIKDNSGCTPAQIAASEDVAALLTGTSS